MFEYEIPGTVLDKKADIKGSADASIENVIPDDLSRRYWIHLIYTPQVLQMRPGISKKWLESKREKYVNISRVIKKRQKKHHPLAIPLP